MEKQEGLLEEEVFEGRIDVRVTHPEHSKPGDYRGVQFEAS